MRVLVGGPTVYEESNGDKNCPWNHEGNTEFWFSNVVVAFLQFAINSVINGRANLCAEEEADTERYVVEPPNPSGFVIHLLPHAWERGKDKVHETVQVCPSIRYVSRERAIPLRSYLHVQGKNLDNNLSANQSKWAY